LMLQQRLRVESSCPECRSLGETASALRNADKSGTNQPCCSVTATTASYHPQAGTGRIKGRIRS
jgi:hypothetical protein